MGALKILFLIVTVTWQNALFMAILLDTFIKLGRAGRRAERVFAACVRIHQELWIAAPPGIAIGAVMTIHGTHWWTIIFNACTLYNWVLFRDWPDENIWKRRGRKLRDKVTVQDGKLVVVGR